jgi:hypothetical protein
MECLQMLAELLKEEMWPLVLGLISSWLHPKRPWQLRCTPFSSHAHKKLLNIWGNTREGSLFLLNWLKSECSDLYNTLNKKVTTFHFDFIKHCLSNPQVHFDITS